MVSRAVPLYETRYIHLSLSNSAEFNAGINASTDSAQNKIYWLALAVLWSAACQG